MFEEKLKDVKILPSFLIVIWILFTLWLLSLIGLTTAWPAFRVLNLNTIIGINKSNIIKVFASSTSGILIAVIFLYLVGITTPLIGHLPAIYSWLFVILMVLLTLEPVFPVFINTHAFIVLTYALVDITTFVQDWPKTLVTVYLGGGFALAGVIGILKLVGKKAERKNQITEEKPGYQNQ